MKVFGFGDFNEAFIALCNLKTTSGFLTLKHNVKYFFLLYIKKKIFEKIFC